MQVLVAASSIAPQAICKPTALRLFAVADLWQAQIFADGRTVTRSVDAVKSDWFDPPRPRGFSRANVET